MLRMTADKIQLEDVTSDWDLKTSDQQAAFKIRSDEDADAISSFPSEPGKH